VSKQQNILQHLGDIDFRKRENRQENAIEDFKEWYEDLVVSQELDYSERVQGQLTMLSSILWYLLPPADYKKLTKLKKR
jgi:hypothetical protein